MAQRDGETVEQWRSRLMRSCYRCGKEFADAPAVSLHEDVCTGEATA